MDFKQSWLTWRCIVHKWCDLNLQDIWSVTHRVRNVNKFSYCGEPIPQLNHNKTCFSNSKYVQFLRSNCGHSKITVATIAPPVDHSFAPQELDIITIWKISFIVVLLWNLYTTGTGLIYYLKSKFYCGICCGFTISVI